LILRFELFFNDVSYDAKLALTLGHWVLELVVRPEVLYGLIECWDVGHLILLVGITFWKLKWLAILKKKGKD
jgi:hypothetical protein